MRPSFSAVLLAGGKSSRMGENKALLEIDGSQLWQRQLRLLRDLGPDEIFIAGELPPASRVEGCTMVDDAQPNAGPLAGLTTALGRSQASLLLALAIDLPAMTADYLANLLTLCTGGRGIIPRLSQRFEPLAAIYPVTALPCAQSCLTSGRYSLQGFAENCIAAGLLNAKQISAAEGALFFNLNTPEDLAVFRNS